MDFDVLMDHDSDHMDVRIGGYTIPAGFFTAKSAASEYPTAGKLLLAAMAACTASTAYSYCQRNGLPLPTGVHVHVDEAGDLEKIHFEINLPLGFPETRIAAVSRAANACWVKHQWLNPPEFETQVVCK